MARGRVLSSFVVTLGVLALLVALSMRKAGASVAPPSGDGTTLVAYHPVAGMIRPEVASVHVVNLGRDHDAAPEEFNIMFVDPRGVLVGETQHCEIRAGETCSALLLSQNCPTAPKGRCEFRAVVVGDPMPCVTPDMGTGDWITNLELIEGSGSSKYVAGENAVLHLPTGGSCTPVDLPPPPPDGGSVDLPAVDVGSSDLPSIDIGFQPDGGVAAPTRVRR
jgi:hypothetical protein